MAVASVSYTFAPLTLIESAEANTNFQDLVSFLNNQVVHKDGTVAFTGVPTGPDADPVSDNQLVRKKYVDVPVLCLERPTVGHTSSGSATDYVSAWTELQNRGFTTAAGPMRFAPLVTGVYILGFEFGFTTSAAGTNRAFGIRRASDNVHVMSDVSVDGTYSSGFGNRLSATGLFTLSSTEEYKPMYRQDSGGSLTGEGTMWVLGVPGTF